jgi:GntR family transcriptional regulator
MNMRQPFISDLANAPIYVRVASKLRQQIASGDIRAGDTLPSERELCEIMQASRVTIRKAIDTLIAERLIVRKQGSGTFVMPRIEAPGSLLSSFSEDAQQRGDHSEVIWMKREMCTAQTDEAALLGVATGTAVARFSRVRLSAGEPLAIENATVPAVFLPDARDVTDSLYAALAARGHRPSSGTQKIRAGLATQIEASLLSIDQGCEVLRIERLTRLPDGRAVELTRSSYRGDRYDFVTELRA